MSKHLLSQPETLILAPDWKPVRWLASQKPMMYWGEMTCPVPCSEPGPHWLRSRRGLHRQGRHHRHDVPPSLTLHTDDENRTLESAR
jgi:hypothetical protein